MVKSKGRRRAASLKAGPEMAGRAKVAASHAGLAHMERLPDGESELRLATGEVYRLGKDTLRRIV